MKPLVVAILLLIQPLLAEASSCKAFLLRKSANQTLRADLVRNHTDRVFRTVEQNKRWIGAAKEKRKGLYAEFTVSELKNLNDKIINDKDLVTALVNLRKDYELNALEELGEEALKGAEIYSDYKTLRIFIPVEGAAAEVLAEKIEKLLYQVDRDYKEKLIQEGLIRKSDLKTSWFEMGVGETADLAAIGARLAKIEGKKTLNMFLKENRDLLEGYRLKIQSAFERIVDLNILLTTGWLNFNFKTVEVFRKNREPKALKKALQERFGLNIPHTRAKEILDFFKLADLFSPSLMIAERTTVTVDFAEFGAFSLDFAGLGAANLQGTIAGILSSRSLEDLFVRVRENEEVVTAAFNADKKKIENTVMEHFRVHQEEAVTRKSKTQEEPIVKFSGDEGVIVPNREVTMDDIMKLQKDFLGIFGGTSQLRMTYIRSTAEGKLETDMVSFAEAVEKALKKKLVNRIPPEVLEKTQFNIWVKKEILEGQRALELDLYSSAVHTPRQRSFIRNAFNDVIIEMNLLNPEVEFQPAPHVYGMFLE